MKKSFSMMVLALVAVSLLLVGCNSESPDAARDYAEALLAGDGDAAQQVACESFQARTDELAAYFGQHSVRDVDLKFDVGKGGREEESIVTGSFTYGPEDAARELKLQEKDKTRIVLWMTKTGDEWCVNETSVVGEGLLALGDNPMTPGTDEMPEETTEDMDDAG